MNILITGATDGIGLALARHYQQTGARLILIGRRAPTDLDQSLFAAHSYCQSDLSDPGSVADISTWLHEQGITEINLVIHNAALGYIGAIEQQRAEHIRTLLQINLWSPIALTHLLYPLVKRANGKFAFISSVATGMAGPKYAVYTATKAALEGFVRSWQIELAADRSPVRAQIIRPGATRTQMHQKSGGNPAQMGWQRFASPTAVADQIIQALATDRRVVTLGMSNQLIHWVGTQFRGPVDALLRNQTRRNQQNQPNIAKHLTASSSAAPHCVITGAADGIGRALAQTMAAAGYIITGIDIDAERAAQTQAELAASGATVHFIQADLADSAAVGQIIAQLGARPPIDLFIHNAGISAVGPFVQSNLARQQAVIAINFAAPLLLTAGLLADGQMTTASAFVFISSLSHFASYPGAAVYAASKDGIASYARSLGVALAARQIHVLTVYPGPTRTAHARRYSPDNRREAKRMPPSQLAAHMLTALQKRRRQLIPGFSNRAVALISRLWPQPIEQIMRRTLYDRLR